MFGCPVDGFYQNICTRYKLLQECLLLYKSHWL
jgi:hypothetical protein